MIEMDVTCGKVTGEPFDIGRERKDDDVQERELDLTCIVSLDVSLEAHQSFADGFAESILHGIEECTDLDPLSSCKEAVGRQRSSQNQMSRIPEMINISLYP